METNDRAAAAFAAVRWCPGSPPVVRLLDQRLLPTATVYLDCCDPNAVAEAIRTLTVRGAPAIGIAAAYGLAQALAIDVLNGLALPGFAARLGHWRAFFAATRPTAVNLFWALDRMVASGLSKEGLGLPERVAALGAEALAIHSEDIEACLAIGGHGALLMPDQGGVLTHCNAGALATGGHGTALGVIRSAVAMGKRLHVWVDETRPLLQGARLTAWECVQDKIPATLITDNMAAHVMQSGRIQAAVTGADRIARNGDSANKIGTYGVAILCRHHNIPFYIAAPMSTVDLACPNGAAIPIEERNSREVSHLGGVQVAPEEIAIYNPGFDVVPAALITAIITEFGVARFPFAADLSVMAGRAAGRPHSPPRPAR